MIKKIAFLLTFLIFLGFLYVQSKTPLTDRNWNPDQAVLPSAEINGDEIHIKNVRNFLYASTTSYEARYYDTTVQLGELERVDYIVEPFGDIGAAHTFLSFGFKNGQQIAISVEIRKEVGESFSPWRGLLNEYELMYVIADERDVIDLRANHRNHTVYVYPATASRDAARTLFVDMLKKANALSTNPEFYNTFTNNCTTNIADHVNAITPNRIGFDIRLVLPEYSDALAQEVGLIAQTLTLPEARRLYQVNAKAAEYRNDPDFSRKIREDWPVLEQAKEGELYEVVKVVDGDTIEVRIGTDTVPVRYIGIDAPEVFPPEAAECQATEAANRNRELVLGKMVRLEKDTRDVDDYARLLRYVFIDDIFVNEQLVKDGLAEAKRYPPDTRESNALERAETVAKDSSRGMWGVCQR